MLPEDCLANILDVPPSCSARQTEISKHTEQGCFAGIYVTTKENFFFLFKNNSYTLLYFIYIFFWGGGTYTMSGQCGSQFSPVSPVEWVLGIELGSLGTLPAEPSSQPQPHPPFLQISLNMLFLVKFF